MIDEVYLARRAEKHIKGIIEKLDLNLAGQSVLTEAGSGHFIYTPIISAIACADKTNVWIKDSDYGRAVDIGKRLFEIIDILNLNRNKFNLSLNKRPVEDIREASIITNLGSVRPLNKGFLKEVNKSAVISYMCEAWEIRPNDVDINYCKENNIPIAGVWENHPDLLIFKGCGPLSIKLCFEAGLEVYQNTILIVSGDKFGEVAKEAFESIGCKYAQIIKPAEITNINLSEFDIVFVADYSFQEEIIGGNLSFKILELQNTSFVHLCGAVDYDYLQRNGVFCYPNQNGSPFKMTRTLAHLGLKPVIELHAAGLKVGASLVGSIPDELIQII